jgi:hypothetical protein
MHMRGARAAPPRAMVAVVSHFEIIVSATPISMGGNTWKPKIHPTIVVIQDEAGANRLAKNKLPIPPSNAKMPTVRA